MSYQIERQTDGWPDSWTEKQTQFHRTPVLCTNPKAYPLPTRDEVTPSVNLSCHPWRLYSLTTSVLRYMLNKNNRNSESYYINFIISNLWLHGLLPSHSLGNLVIPWEKEPGCSQPQRHKNILKVVREHSKF